MRLLEVVTNRLLKSCDNCSIHCTKKNCGPQRDQDPDKFCSRHDIVYCRRRRRLFISRDTWLRKKKRISFRRGRHHGHQVAGKVLELLNNASSVQSHTSCFRFSILCPASRREAAEAGRDSVGVTNLKATLRQHARYELSVPRVEFRDSGIELHLPSFRRARDHLCEKRLAMLLSQLLGQRRV